MSLLDYDSAPPKAMPGSRSEHVALRKKVFDEFVASGADSAEVDMAQFAGREVGTTYQGFMSLTYGTQIKVVTRTMEDGQMHLWLTRRVR